MADPRPARKAWDWRASVAIAASYPLWHIWQIGDDAYRLMDRVFDWAQRESR